MRVRLRVILKLRGTDIDDNQFEEMAATENVSQSGFLCGCKPALKKGSMIEVYLTSEQTRYVGKARVIWSDKADAHYPRYGFRFEHKPGSWILQ